MASVFVKEMLNRPYFKWFPFKMPLFWKRFESIDFFKIRSRKGGFFVCSWEIAGSSPNVVALFVLQFALRDVGLSLTYWNPLNDHGFFSMFLTSKQGVCFGVFGVQHCSTHQAKPNQTPPSPQHSFAESLGGRAAFFGGSGKTWSDGPKGHALLMLIG